MKLSESHPDVFREALSFPSGIHCFRLRGEVISRLVVKLPHPALLTAKTNKGFKLYVVPVNTTEIVTVGLMCAFFDDADCPLTLWRPLGDDSASNDLMHALTRNELLVHLFDEHNREMLGYRAQVDIPLVAKVRLEHAKLHRLDHASFHEVSEVGHVWFSVRTKEDDSDAISILFCDSLFPEDPLVIDTRPEQYQFHGSKGFGHTSLVKTEPGQYQEIDIILLLQRLFPPTQIYHAPKRVYDKEEIADVVVITDDVCLIIQAKDSPNTEQMLGNTLERKRLKSIKQLKEGIGQVSGAINYLDRIRPLRMLIGDTEVEINLGKRMILSLVVVRELFINSYDEYGTLLFKLFEQIQLPCIALDYQELHSYTTYCTDAEGFIGAYFEVFDFAQVNGKFPRLRFGLNDVLRKRTGLS